MICNSCFMVIDDVKDAKICQKCGKPIHSDCAINDGGTFCDMCYLQKDEEITINPYTEKIPNVIRRSYIDVYRKCPYKFYMSVIKDNPMPNNIYTKLGIDLHDMFEKGSNDKSYDKEKMIKDFKEIFKTYDESMFKDLQQKADMFTRGLDSIDTFIEINKEMPSPYATEVKTEFSIGDDLPKVSATFDRVNLVDGELEVIDWKTGNILVGKELSSDLQAPLYIYGIKKHYEMPVRSFTFIYLKDNKIRTFNRVDDSNDYICMVGKRKYCINIIDTVKEVQHIFSQITKGNYNVPINTKKMYFTCKMCHIKEQKLCEGADLQVWNQFNNNKGE